MTKKYEIITSGKHKGRIKALRDFGDVSKGDIGGFVESERNLSHKGDCWVFGNAKVYGDAKIYGNAKVYGDAKIYGNARVFGKARVFGHASVYDDARVFGYARVYDDAEAFGYVWVYDDAMVFGNARVFDNAEVYGDARVFGKAEVYDNARVFGNAEVYDGARVSDNAGVFGKAEVYGYAKVYGGIQLFIDRYDYDVLKDFKQTVARLFGFFPDKNGYYIFYKKVYKRSKHTFRSCHDPSFIYRIGRVSEVLKYDKSHTSCSTGLHVSTPFYWHEGDTIIECLVHIDDIITIAEGKIRCKKLKVLREVSL